MDSFHRLVPPLTLPATVTNDEAFVVRATLVREEGQKRINKAIHDGFFRPTDINAATEVEPMRLLWIPLWRIELNASEYHLGLRREAAGSVLPTGGLGSDQRVFVILARKLLPFDPAPKIKLELSEMEPRSSVRRSEGEIIGPDLESFEAEKIASERIKSSLRPTNALFSKVDVEVRSRAFCYYPIWFSRYRYAGQASANAGPDECHVAISARTGHIVSEKHPSAMRSIAGRIKNLFN